VGNSDALTADLRRHGSVGLDTSVLIYHLEDVSPYADLTTAAFTLLAQGALAAVVSTVTVTELLAKPFADGNVQAVTVCELFLREMPNAEIVPPDFEIAVRAAKLRGIHGLRAPDALLLATALHAGASAFLTNDATLKRVEVEGIKVLLLDDYAPRAPSRR